MRVLLVLSFIFVSEISATAWSQSAQDIGQLIELIEQGNAACTSRQAQCPGDKSSSSGVVAAAEGELTAAATTEAPSQTLIQDLHGRNLNISIIPESQIRDLKGLLPSHLRVYDPEVCSQRAQIIGDTLARQGIETVKLVIRPGGFWPFKGQIVPDNRVRTSNGRHPRWDYHVVNLIYVKTADNKLVEYIIDPFMESYPVPRAQWEQRLRSHPDSSIGSMDIASRFVLDDRDLNRKELSYDERALRRSYEIMAGMPKRSDSYVD